jgi:hypothetical protein
MSYSDWQNYERATKAIFQNILNQQQAQNIKVLHDVKLKGKTVEHQVDVYWEFYLADGINCRAIVECRDWSESIGQEKMMAFKQKLEDLNNPLGIMVTRTGYQAGARKFAETHGILLYELFEELLEERPSGPITVKEGSFGTIKFSLDDLTEEWVYYETTYDNVSLVFDREWVEQETGLGDILGKEKILFPPKSVSQIKLYNNHCVEVGNLLNVFRPFAEDMFSKREQNKKRFQYVFPDPTFVKVDLPNLPYLKALNASLDIVITKHPPKIMRLKLEGIVPFILKNLQTGASDRHLIQRGPREMQS